MKLNEKVLPTNYLNQGDNYTISRQSPYYVDEVYFEEILKNLGLFLAEKYQNGHEVGLDEILSQITYISDLTVQQKMSFALFFGKHLKNNEYEEYILAVMNQVN